MAQVTLQILEGFERGTLYSSLETPLTIGREVSNAIALKDEAISRYHAKIQEDNGRIILTDLSSTNGTRVNGHPIQLKVLQPGDQIFIGRCIILFGSFAEIERLYGREKSEEISKKLRQSSSSFFDVENTDEADDPDMNLAEHQYSIELFPLGCPELPSGLNFVQRAQVSDLLAHVHNRVVALMQESYGEEGAGDEREVRIPWHAWQKLLHTELELARALQNITEPD
ncbi:MAG TPA: FHA domain-containing protein [Planctomycetaceae bacterium]|nr:FHA domain-containing protein [Planctomycetaceae bacterium]